MELKESICITCRHLPYCCLTQHKGFITYCSDYEHKNENYRYPGQKESEEEILFI